MSFITLRHFDIIILFLFARSYFSFFVFFLLISFFFFFFFFQAEDGIRDGRVTGDQTCALPISLALEGSLLVRYAPPAIADAFCASRLAGDHGLEYGTLPAGSDFVAIVERHTPAAA